MIASPPPRAIPFGDLLESLRRQGFPIGLDHYVRLHSLLEVVGGDCEPHRLKTLLCPIFATSREQQEQFYRAFDLSYPMFAHAPVRGGGHGGEADELMPAATKRSRWRTSVYALGGLAAALVAVVVVWRFALQPPVVPLAPLGPDRPTDSAAVSEPPPAAAEPEQVAADTSPAPPAPTAEAPAAPPPAAEPEAPAPVLESFAVRHAKLLQALAIAIPLILFGLNEWRLYRRRRLVIQRQRREKPPFVWPIKVPQPGNPFAESAELQFAARLLREREQGEIERLSVDETVTATIEAMGYPTFRYRTDTRPPDYLVLIERAAFRDHGSRLFNDLGRALEREGVHVARYYYDGDPRICHPESGGDRTLLVDLRRRYPSHRLLVFGTGDAFISPISGRLQPWTSDFLTWNDRALFTPEAPRGWGQREVTLARHFILLPATMQGLVALVDHFRSPIRPSLRAWRDRSTEPLPPSAITAEIWELRAYLGEPAFKWLAACAVYPELHWDLTLHLGQIAALPPDLVTEQNLLRLLRLPWFRAGALTDELRSALVAELDPDTERAVRTAIVELLEADPAPTDSVAGNQYDLELVVQRLALNRDDRKRREELLKQLQTMPRKQIMGDFAVLQLLERAPSTRLAMMLPARLREVFFKEGIPALGMRAGARAGVTAMAMAVLTLGLRLSQPAKPTEDLVFSSQWMDSTSGAIYLLPGEVAEFQVTRLQNGVLFTDLSIRWTVTRPEVVALDSAGTLTGLAPGTSAVHGVSVDGSEVDVTVQVDSAALAMALGPRVEQALDSLVLSPGEFRALSVVVPTQGGRVISSGLIWTVADGSVLRIGSTTGNIDALAIGRTQVVATRFGLEARLPVIVTAATVAAADTAAIPPAASDTTTPGPAPSEAVVATIRVVPESLSLIAGINRPAALAPQAFDRAGTAIPSAAFTFATGERGLIQLSPDGTVAALGDTGHAIVVVTSGTVSTRVGVTVRAARIVRTTVELEPKQLTMRVGERSRITARFSTTDEAGRQLPAALVARWRSEDPAVATVAGDGTVTAVAVGRVTISAGDSTAFLGSAELEVQPAAAAEPAPPAPAGPTVVVLDAAAIAAIQSRVDAAMALLAAGRLSDPSLSLVYPGTDANAQRRARDQLTAFFRDTDFKARGARQDAAKLVGQQAEADFQIPFEWHDSFGRSRKATATFRAVLSSTGSGWDLKEVRLVKAFP